MRSRVGRTELLERIDEVGHFLRSQRFEDVGARNVVHVDVLQQRHLDGPSPGSFFRAHFGGARDRVAGVKHDVHFARQRVDDLLKQVLVIATPRADHDVALLRQGVACCQMQGRGQDQAGCGL